MKFANPWANLIRKLARHTKAGRRRSPQARSYTYRPALETLECRLAPSVDVLTYHNDSFRTGANLEETLLTPANVNAGSFGKLFSYPVDGYVYAQPLYKTNVAIPGRGTHNVVFVATEHDSVYALDADNANPTAGGLLWQSRLLNRVSPFARSVTPVPSSDIFVGYGDIVPEIGITGTPVIDPATGTIYVVAMTKQVLDPFGIVVYVQQLYALDITTGAERFGGPVTIQTSGFNPLRANQRAGLVLSNGVVYISWAGFGDYQPYYGWLIGYDARNLGQVAVFNTSPIAQGAGIWQSGAAPGVDSSGNLYFATGNGPFGPQFPFSFSYGDTVLKLSTNGGLRVDDYFTPFNQAQLRDRDWDLGSGGVVLLPDQPGPHQHLLVTAGKEGKIYLVDRDTGHMGGYNGRAVRTESCKFYPMLWVWLPQMVSLVYLPTSTTGFTT
jgi:hypothetical protein